MSAMRYLFYLLSIASLAVVIYLTLIAYWPLTVSIRRTGNVLEVSSGWLARAAYSVELIGTDGKSLYKDSTFQKFPFTIPAGATSEIQHVIITVQYDRFVPSAETLTIVPE